MARSDLQRRAYDLAGLLQTLINGTVADNVRILSTQRGRDTVAVGTNMSGAFRSQPVGLRSTSRRHRCYLDVALHVYLENGTGYLTTLNSYFGVHIEPGSSAPFLHYDYERGKSGYPEAHVQVRGRNDRLETVMDELCAKRKTKRLNELHLPVGGRRFRPALEDVLEFLIEEDLVDPKAGWREALDATRDEFRRIQLKAAVRRDQATAAEALSENGWQVSEPVASLPRQRRSRNRHFA